MNEWIPTGLYGKSNQVSWTLCIDKGDIDARDQLGLVPAMWACYGDRLENLLLLEKIARKHRYSSVKMTQDYNGLRCLYYALRSKHGFRCLEHLLTRHRAHTLDPHGQTVLHHAAVLGSGLAFIFNIGLLNACRIILKHTGHTLIDMVDRYNRTALHLATVTGNGNIVKTLLEHQVLAMIWFTQATRAPEILSSSSSEIVLESQRQVMRRFESPTGLNPSNSKVLSSQPGLILRTSHVGEPHLQKRHTFDLSTEPTSVERYAISNSKASVDISGQFAHQVSPGVTPDSVNSVNMGESQAQTSNRNFLSTKVNLRPKSFKCERSTCRKTVSPLSQPAGAELRGSHLQANGFKRLSTVKFLEAPVTQLNPEPTTTVKSGATSDVSDIDILNENRISQRVIDLKTTVLSVPFHLRRELPRMRLPSGENVPAQKTVNGQNTSNQANRRSSCSSISEMEQEELCLIQNQRASGRSKLLSCPVQSSIRKHPQSACVTITDKSTEKSPLLKRTQVNRTLQSVKQFFKKTEKRLVGPSSTATLIRPSNNEEFVEMQQKRTNSSGNIWSCNTARLDHSQHATKTTIPVSPFQMVRKSFLSPTLGQATSKQSLPNSMRISLQKCVQNSVNVERNKNLR
ncbi:hypothetical protein P879_00074 [Paragonimus westermani]|uniref:Uncharacterized protein n=1 Tax=Paragonimus westermani TaxID=34504 RepID=A0A8T0DWX1_9TREM|nr:hypothetical protein P879_00074 [Paragonimus westermani]